MSLLKCLCSGERQSESETVVGITRNDHDCHCDKSLSFLHFFKTVIFSQSRSTNSYGHDNVVCLSVCLSVTLCIAAKRYILQQKCLNN